MYALVPTGGTTTVGKVRVQPTDQVCEDLGAAEALNNA